MTSIWYQVEHAGWPRNWYCKAPSGETFGPFATRDEARQVRRAAVRTSTHVPRTIELTMRETQQARQSFWQRLFR